MSTRTIVIIGASAAGIAAVSTLRRLMPQAHQLVCITQEQYKPYNTCLLASCLAQHKTFDDTGLLTSSWYNDPVITWLTSMRVNALDTRNQTVMLHTGQTFEYSKLLLALGTVPVLAPLHALWIEQYINICTFYNATDMHNISSFIQKHNVTDVAILGAGLTGVECADALCALNLRVWLIESSDRVIPGLLDTQASLWLLQKIPATLTVITQVSVSTVQAQAHTIQALVLSNGQELSVQLVIIATGVRPAIELAKQAGLATQPAGIVVDELFRTSCPNIYAAGDCALTYSKITRVSARSSTWAEALAQGSYAARALIGSGVVYPGVTTCATTTVFGVPIGYYRLQSADEHIAAYWYSTQDASCRLFVDADTRVLCGGVVLGNIQGLPYIKQACETSKCYDASMFSRILI